MRLDRLLSREPSFVGNSHCVCLLWWVWWLVFLCSHVFTALSVGWWVWVRFGLGINVVMDEHTVGFTFNTV